MNICLKLLIYNLNQQLFIYLTWLSEQVVVGVKLKNFQEF